MIETDGQSQRGNRAVSPVIGVILMVAITVILAAVIGAFVLEIGDQQETAPSTSFDTEQQMLLYCATNADNCDGAWARANLTTVGISHAGGEVIDVSQVEVKVGGNASVYGSVGPAETNYAMKYPNNYPVPDFVPALGTNERVEFTSGETWSIHSHSDGEGFYAGLSHENYERWVSENDDCLRMKFNNGDPENAYFHQGNCPDWSSHRHLSPLEQGETTNVVWSAESGGKTQNLFKYTVQ